MGRYEALVGEAMQRQRSQDAPGAVALLRQAIALDETRPEAWQDLGVLLDGIGQTAAALNALRCAVDRDERRYEAWYLLAFVTGRERPADGIAIYRELLGRWPEDFAGWHNLGCLLRAVGRLDEAIEALKTARRIKADSPALAFNLGKTHEALGEFDEATACYAESVALFPGFEPGLAALVRLRAERSGQEPESGPGGR